MADQEDRDLQSSFETNPGIKDDFPTQKDTQKDDENVIPASKDHQLTAEKQTPEIATNDGSVIETLDTAFHGTPGWSEGENISGSNRADYYEARSYGKSDAEEELDVIRERNGKVPDDEKKE